MVPEDVSAELFRRIEADPNLEITVDLPSQTVQLPGGTRVSFPIDNFSKQCLLAGVDQLGYLLKQEPRIRAYEASHPALVETAAS